MEISKSKTGLILAVSLIAGLAVGRYATPAKTQIKIQEKIVTKEVVKWKTKYVKDQQNNKETVTIETRFPDGTIKKETRVVDKGVIRVDVAKDGSKEAESETSKTTEITKSSKTNDWHVSAVITNSHSSDNLMSGPTSYGVHVERRIIGPFYLGAFGITNKTYGASIGMTF